MSYQTLFLCLLLGVYPFCTPPKISETPTVVATTAKPMNKSTIKVVFFEQEQQTTKDIATEKSDSIVQIVTTLLTDSEPMRVALEDEEMAQLKTNTAGFELYFSPPLTTHVDAAGLSKMLFLNKGSFSTTNQSTDAKFFIALANDNQYISSPYVSEKAASSVYLLEQLLKSGK